jgi:hypothetical protein
MFMYGIVWDFPARRITTTTSSAWEQTHSGFRSSVAAALVAGLLIPDAPPADHA